MKQKPSLKARAAAIIAATAAAATSAMAGPVEDATDAIDSMATPVGAGITAIFTIALLFVGVKMGKRLLGKV